MLVIKSARWGGTCAVGMRSRILRLLSTSESNSTSNTSETFHGPYLLKDASNNKNTFQEIKKKLNNPTRIQAEAADAEVLGTAQTRAMKRHLLLLKKYQNENSLRLVFEGLKDLPLHTEQNGILLQDFLACVRRIDTTDNIDSLFALTDVYCFVAERGIGVGSEAANTRNLAETLIGRIPNHSEMREYNRNFSRFVEALQPMYPELVVPCVQKALPALKIHQNSIMMTEQLRILAVVSDCPDLDTESQQYFLRVAHNLETCCELFDFSELHSVLECIDHLDKASPNWTVYEDLRKSLFRMVANIERRFTREILGPLHNPVAYSRSLALLAQLGATDVKMQILKDKLESLILPRYSMAKFIEESGHQFSNPSRAQRSWLLNLIMRDANLYQFDADNLTQTRARDNKRKTESDIQLFCNNLLKGGGIQYLACPLKIMQVAKWKESNLSDPVLLTQEQVQRLEQVMDFSLKCSVSNSNSQAPARWLKEQLIGWKSTTPDSKQPPDGGRPLKMIGSQVEVAQTKPLLNLSSLAFLYDQTCKSQQSSHTAK